MAVEYKIKGFKSKYPFKQEPRKQYGEIVHDGPVSEINPELLKKCTGRPYPNDKFAIIFKSN